MDMRYFAPVPVPDLSGRVILVTGAGQGIGAALVRILHAKGARVFAGIHGDPAEPLPEGVTILPLDVTRQADVDATVARIAPHGLEVLVNNAGSVVPICPLADLAADALTSAFSVNVVGVQRMVAACLPLLRLSGGHILNAGTEAATTPTTGLAAYCTSTAALHMLTRLMAMELAPVKCFLVGIPPTDTAMQGMIREQGRRHISPVPQNALLPVDVPASVLAWLCSDAVGTIDEVLLDVRQDRFTAMMVAR